MRAESTDRRKGNETDSAVLNDASKHYIHTYSFNNQLTYSSDTIKIKMIKQIKITNSKK